MLLELSVVTNTQHHFLAARNHKEDRYSSLLLDLQHTGLLAADHVTIEVGCPGHIMPATVTKLKLSKVCHLPKSTVRYTLQQAACVANSCSYRIFNSWASASWDIVDLLIFQV